jgi:hypothetical protein
MSDLKQKFDEWNKENPEVYALFKRFSFEAISKGHKRLSAWMIANRIRWETTIATTGNDYKISNDFIALFARKFMEDYPEHEGFFKTKTMKRA